MGLEPETVLPLLRGAFGKPYLHCDVCTSTQDVLRGTDLPAGAVAVAEHQVAGRGRSGRRWEDAPSASILVSILLRPPPKRPIAELSLVCALAVIETVERTTGLASQVKWPNDVLLDGRKVAGTLLEADGDAVVAGIGINVNQEERELPSETQIPAASLRTVSGRSYDRATLLAALLERLEELCLEWQRGGIAAAASALEARNWLRDRRVEIDAGSGTAGAIRADGLLDVHLDDGKTVTISSGAVRLG